MSDNLWHTEKRNNNDLFKHEITKKQRFQRTAFVITPSYITRVIQNRISYFSSRLETTDIMWQKTVLWIIC